MLAIMVLAQPTWAADLAVTDFGAVANNNKDAAAAINGAVAKAQPGDTVVIPKGTFLLADSIIVKKGITLKGAGQGATRLVHGGEKSCCLIRIEGANNVEIAGMTLDGLDSRKAEQGIIAAKCDGLRLHRLTIQNFVRTGAFGPHGILCSAISNSTISDNTIRNIAPKAEWGAAMRIDGHGPGNRILRNIIDNTGRGGIFTSNGAADAIISENIITGSHGIAFAIEVHDRCSRTVIEDNIVDHGLSIVTGGCAIRRNLVVDPTGNWSSFGIECGGTPDGIVTDNVIDYGQDTGISMSGADHYGLWMRNSFSNCCLWGIQMQGPGQNQKIHCIYFYNNTFRKAKRGHPAARYPGADGHAIRFNNHVENVVFDSNRIIDNGGLGIQVNGDDVSRISFINNIITNNGLASIDHCPPAVIWENNLVSGNGVDTQLKTQGFTGEAPVASFSCPATARVGVPVQFQNTSTAPGSQIEHVLWDFDAGVPATEVNPTYTYSRPGAYRVSMIVWNKDGRGARPAEKIIRVSAE